MLDQPHSLETCQESMDSLIVRVPLKSGYRLEMAQMMCLVRGDCAPVAEPIWRATS